tara:strand:- start:15 stop:173 length:159 start_codon:yes stop_codon:yes gene_type:complete
MSIKQYNDLVQLNVWVSWGLRKRLKRAAVEQGVSQSHIVRGVLAQYLDQRDK